MQHPRSSMQPAGQGRPDHAARSPWRDRPLPGGSPSRGRAAWLVFGALALVQIGTLSVLSFDASNERHAASERRAGERIAQLAGDVGHRLRTRTLPAQHAVQALVVLARSGRLDVTDDAAVRQALDSALRAAGPLVEELRLTRLDGSTLAAAHEDGAHEEAGGDGATAAGPRSDRPDATDRRMRPWFTAALTAGGPVWSRPAHDPALGQRATHVSVAVRDARGRTQAVIAAALAARVLDAAVRATPLAPDVTVVVADRSGTVVTASPNVGPDDGASDGGAHEGARDRVARDGGAHDGARDGGPARHGAADSAVFAAPDAFAAADDPESAAQPPALLLPVAASWSGTGERLASARLAPLQIEQVELPAVARLIQRHWASAGARTWIGSRRFVLPGCGPQRIGRIAAMHPDETSHAPAPVTAMTLAMTTAMVAPAAAPAAGTVAEPASASGTAMVVASATAATAAHSDPLATVPPWRVIVEGPVTAFDADAPDGRSTVRELLLPALLLCAMAVLGVSGLRSGRSGGWRSRPEPARRLRGVA